ncbi:MAG: Gfo/Idh/MocA family oxidoreductase [Candidatus Bipolaricaulota bacterium]
MVEACDAEGVELFVAHYRRFYPQVEKIRELLEEGKAGKPVQAYVHISFTPPADVEWREELEISGGGWFVDVASHRLDLLAFLLGPIEQANGVVTFFESDNELEDTVTLSLKFDSGAQASVQGDFYTHRPSDELYLHGTEGTIYTDDLSEPKVLLSGKEQEEYEVGSLGATHSGLVEHVEEVLLDGASNRSSGADGLITEEVLDNTIRVNY